MSEPIIYTKNYVNADDVFTVSHGSGAWGNAYNRDKSSQWQSTGAADDTTAVQIDITFYENATAISRAIDRLILINHNLKDFVIYYWDGTTYQTWLTVTGEEVANSVITLSPQTIAKARIIMTATQTANQDKAIGELILCQEMLNIGADLQTYDVAFREKSKTLLMGDGSIQKVLVYWSPHRTEKYEAKVKFTQISQATLLALAAIKEVGLPFLWYPESEAQPDLIYYVHWANTLKWKYTTPYKAAGLDVEIDLKEV
jgi:hypothetical protein